MMKKILLAVCLAAVASSSCFAQDGKEAKKEGWHVIEGKETWLNPGDSYEHDTDLIRDQYGNKYRPIRKGEKALARNSGANAATSRVYQNQGNSTSQRGPYYGPRVHPQYRQPSYQPNYTPAPRYPTYPAWQYQPYYVPAYPPRYVPYYNGAYGQMGALFELKMSGTVACAKCGRECLVEDIDPATGVSRWCSGKQEDKKE